MGFPIFSDCLPNEWGNKKMVGEMIDKLEQQNAVYRPPHYTQGSVECIEAIKAALTPEEYRGYLKGNLIKYTWREKHKGGLQDIEKASSYLQKLLEVTRNAKLPKAGQTGAPYQGAVYGCPAETPESISQSFQHRVQPQGPLYQTS